MKKLVSAAVMLAAAATALPAAAQFAKAEDAIKYRKAAFTLLGGHFGALGNMANGKIPYNADVAAEAGDVIAVVAKLPWRAFAAGTDKGDTRAKPEIWKEEAKFKEGAEKMQAEVAKVAAAAKSGNLDNLKATFGAAGQSCKSCHDSYRKD